MLVPGKAGPVPSDLTLIGNSNRVSNAEPTRRWLLGTPPPSPQTQKDTGDPNTLRAPGADSPGSGFGFGYKDRL